MGKGHLLPSNKTLVMRPFRYIGGPYAWGMIANMYLGGLEIKEVSKVLGFSCSRVSAPNVRFFLFANEIKTAKANVVQRMNFIASTLGRGSVTRERALSQGSRAQGRAAGVSLCAPSGEVPRLRRGESGKSQPGQGTRVFIGHRWGWGKSVLESRGRVLLGTAGDEERR